MAESATAQNGLRTAIEMFGSLRIPTHRAQYRRNPVSKPTKMRHALACLSAKNATKPPNRDPRTDKNKRRIGQVTMKLARSPGRLGVEALTIRSPRCAGRTATRALD